MTIAVVIPFYQKTPGILIKSVNSVFSQSAVDDFRIYIVNDESPIDPHKELCALKKPNLDRITILHRKNGGPGQARNTALEEIRDKSYDYVAFLDSDDIWDPDHLKTAIGALSEGYDFYFSDFYQLNNSESVFDKAQKKGSFNINDHRIIKEGHIFEYTGDFIEQIITANIIGTPTVVFRKDVFNSILFKKEFYYCGEDYLFWLDAASKSTKIAFSSYCACRCGEGVNVYSSNGWGTSKSLERIRDELKYMICTKNNFPLRATAEAIRNSKIRSLKLAVFYELKHRIFRLKPINMTTLMQITILLIKD